METTLRFAGQAVPVYVEGDVISDYQLLWVLRHLKLIPDDRNAYSVGVGNGRAFICHHERLPSGKLSAKIVDDGYLTIDGYAYRCHVLAYYPNGPDKPFSGQATWSFKRVS